MRRLNDGEGERRRVGEREERLGGGDDGKVRP